MQKHDGDPGLPTQEHGQHSFPRSNPYGCLLAAQTCSLVPGRHWQPARLQSVEKGPEETERQMGQHGCSSRAAHLNTLLESINPSARMIFKYAAYGL